MSFKSDVDWNSWDHLLIDALNQHGNDLPRGVLRGLADQIGCNRHQVRRRLNKLEKEGRQKQAGPSLGQQKWKESEHRGTAEGTYHTDREVRTLADLIAVTNPDLETWSIYDWECTKWDSMAKNENTQEAEVVPLWRVKVRFKRRASLEPERVQRDILDEIRTAASRSKRKVKAAKGSGDLMYVISPADLHIGRYAPSFLTGGIGCSTEQAIEAANTALTVLLDRVQGQKIEKIKLLIGNDMMHVDSELNQTTRGTRQDVDSHWQQIFRICWRMIVDVVEQQMLEIAPVEIDTIPGNHAKHSETALGELLLARLEHNKHVTVNADGSPRKYTLYGVNMLAAAHGDEAPPHMFGQLMNTEQPAMYSAAKFHEVLGGHLHKESKKHQPIFTDMKDVGDVVYRVMPSLAPPDIWTSRMGYVGSRLASKGILYHKTDGPGTEHTVFPFILRERSARGRQAC